MRPNSNAFFTFSVLYSPTRIMGQKYFIWMAFVLSAIGCGRGQGILLGEGTSYLNGTGSSAAFHLPDGSKVVLLPDTRIVVLSGTVELDGEALFEVAAGGFRIDTRDMKI